MKKIRRHLRELSLLLSVSILFFSCSQYDDIGSGNIDEQTNSKLFKKDGQKYSGEEILEGLFFFKNDISNGIPQLVEVKASMLKGDTSLEVDNTISELSQVSIDFINKNYPTFFNDLQAKMYSGNLFEVSSAIDMSARLIEQAGLSSEKFQAIFLASKKVANSETLQAQISSLDLSTKEGIEELGEIIKSSRGTEIDNSNNCVAFAGAAAVFYIAVAAVSIAVAAYSVYYKVAYWGPRVKGDPSIAEERNIYISDGGVEIERDILVSQIGRSFSQN